MVNAGAFFWCLSGTLLVVEWIVFATGKFSRDFAKMKKETKPLRFRSNSLVLSELVEGPAVLVKECRSP